MWRRQRPGPALHSDAPAVGESALHARRGHQLLIELFDALLELGDLALRIGADAVRLTAQTGDLVVLLRMIAGLLGGLTADVFHVVTQAVDLLILVGKT